MKRIYFAKWLLRPDHTLLHNAAIAVEDTRIKEVAPRSGISQSREDVRINLGNVLLMPGLINIHTRLEESVLRHIPREPDESFSAWRIKKESRLARFGAEQIIPRVRNCIRELLSSGVTSVADSSQSGISLPVLRDEPIRSWFFRTTPFARPVSLDEIQEQFQRYIRIADTADTLNVGIHPATLFSLSPRQHRDCIAFAQTHSLAWAMHLAESAEELQAFSEHRGDLYAYVTNRIPWHYPVMARGPVHYVLTNQFLPRNAILLHCSYITGLEMSLLRSQKAHVAIAPRHIAYHGHKEFPLDVARNRHIPLCVMTESPASCDSLSLFDELFFIKQKYPHIPVSEMLSWVTTNPARALGMGHTLGICAPDACADLIALRVPVSSQEDVLEEMFESDPDISFVMVNGEEVIVDY